MHTTLDAFRYNLNLGPIARTLGSKSDLAFFREVKVEFDDTDAVERDIRQPARHEKVRQEMRRLRIDLPPPLHAEVFDYLIEDARLRRAPEYIRDVKIKRYVDRIRERVVALNWKMLERAEKIRDEITEAEVAQHEKWGCPYEPTTLRKSFEKTCADLRAMLESNSIVLYNGAPPASDLGGWFEGGL